MLHGSWQAKNQGVEKKGFRVNLADWNTSPWKAAKNKSSFFSDLATKKKNSFWSSKKSQYNALHRNDDKIGKCHVSCFKISKSKDPVSDWIDHKIGSDCFLPKNRIWIQQIYSHIFLFSLSMFINSNCRKIFEDAIHSCLILNWKKLPWAKISSKFCSQWIRFRLTKNSIFDGTTTLSELSL